MLNFQRYARNISRSIRMRWELSVLSWCSGVVRQRHSWALAELHGRVDNTRLFLVPTSGSRRMALQLRHGAYVCTLVCSFAMRSNPRVRILIIHTTRAVVPKKRKEKIGVRGTLQTP